MATRNLPKWPLSAFMHFSLSNREMIKKDNPTATFGQLGKILGTKWNNLSPTEKQPYIELAALDKQRYLNEKKRK